MELPHSPAMGADLHRRLRSRAFSLEEAKAAMRGEVLPTSLGRLATQHAVVHGIRHHPAFAAGPAAVLRGLRPIFTRALNARAIMSNQVPDIDPNSDDDAFPYCIWHPDLPSEDTLRKLAARYPQMRYQVGRACAAAGYTELYRSCGLLPEVAIAEEARESGSMEIYEDILKAPVKWQVFDDYAGVLHRTDPRPGARLNGDTCPRSWLDRRQPIRPPVGLVQGEEGDPEPGDDADPELSVFSDDAYYEVPGFPGYLLPHFNVGEDMQLGLASSVKKRLVFDSPDWDADLALPVDPDAPHEPPEELSDVVARLMWQPLPDDLPTCDKDWLILMAAYNGNTDRYARLRRPYFVKWELACIKRGIYHNVMFARWWADQNLEAYTDEQRLLIEKAVHARYIMSDDLSRLLGRRADDVACPYYIWYPDIASQDTYKALAVHFPRMRPQIMRAAIYADYQQLFDLIISDSVPAPAPPLPSDGVARGPDPSPGRPHDQWSKPRHYHYLESTYSHNPHYKTTLLRKAAELDVDITRLGNPAHSQVNQCVAHFHKGRDDITPFYIEITRPDALYTCDARRLEFHVLSCRDWRLKAEDVQKMEQGDWYTLCYEDWPRSVWKLRDD